jgi:hypothetical protein
MYSFLFDNFVYLSSLKLKKIVAENYKIYLYLEAFLQEEVALKRMTVSQKMV